MVLGAQRLEVRRVIGAAVDLGQDVVHLGGRKTAGAGVRRPPPQARGVPQQLLGPTQAPVRPIPALRRRPATTGDAAPWTGGDPQASRAGVCVHGPRSSSSSTLPRTVAGLKTPARMTTPARMSITGPRMVRSNAQAVGGQAGLVRSSLSSSSQSDRMGAKTSITTAPCGPATAA